MPKSRYAELADSLAMGSWITETAEANWGFGKNSTVATVEQMRTAAIIDIMISLRSIRRTVQCVDAVKAAKSMQALERLAREFWVRPRKRKKTKTPPKEARR